jgi:hypothetical protein
MQDNVRRDITPAQNERVKTLFRTYMHSTDGDLVGSKNYATRAFWDACINGTWGADYAVLGDMASRMLIATTSEAEVERVFSVLRRILSRHRGGLDSATLFFLLQIYFNGLRENNENDVYY